MINLGEFIRNYRKQRNISMADLAEKIGTTQSALSVIETGRRLPNLTTLYKIGEALGFSGEELERVKQLRNELAHGKKREARAYSGEWNRREPDVIMEVFEGYRTGIDIKTISHSPTVPVNIMSALIENAIKDVLFHEKETIKDTVRNQVLKLSQEFKDNGLCDDD